MSESTRRSIKVGVITDITGPLSFLGIANANVARMVVDDINMLDKVPPYLEIHHPELK